MSRALCGLCGVATVVAATLMMAAAAPVLKASDNIIRGKAYGPGEYIIAGHALHCRRARTVLSSELNDYGAAVPGTIVLNPKRLQRLPATTGLFVYAHECGHQIHGRSEAAADCYAAKRGRSEGWLTRRAISGICNVFPKTAETKSHAARGARCTVIQACFVGKATPRQLSGSRSYEDAARAIKGN